MKILLEEMLCFLVGFVPGNPDEEICMCDVLEALLTFSSCSNLMAQENIL